MFSRMLLRRRPKASGLNAMYWLPDHGYTRESHSQVVAVAMNSHALFIDLATFQVNCISAYPAEMRFVELGLIHLATSLDVRDATPNRAQEPDWDCLMVIWPDPVVKRQNAPEQHPRRGA